MTIALSAGTTTFALARALAGFAGITVVTNSTDAADVLFDALPPSSLVVLTGGVRTPSHALVGPIAEASLKDLQVDIVFHGFHGIDPQSGFTCPNLAEVSTAQAMIASGDRLIVLADHSKFGVRALAKVTDLSSASTLITDARIAPDHLDDLRRRIASVEVADPAPTHRVPRLTGRVAAGYAAASQRRSRAHRSRSASRSRAWASAVSLVSNPAIILRQLGEAVVARRPRGCPNR